MELLGVRPRLSSSSLDFDLENAPFKAHSYEDEAKSKSTLELLKKASGFWFALAACGIFVFFCLSSSFVSRSPSPSLSPSTTTTPPSSASAGWYKPEADENNTVGGSRSAAASAGRVHSQTHAHHYHHRSKVKTPDSPQNATGAAEARLHLPEHVKDYEEASHEEDEEEDEEEDHHLFPKEEEDDDEEPHADNEYMADTHPEHEFSEAEDFDNVKQHPDEPEYIDIWDGMTHEDLHLSSGVPGLKTPLYRLPFLDGQHNNTHVIGVHAKDVQLPRFLSVNGGKRVPAISGTYRMLMVPDGRPKPHLNHGRLIWERENATSPMFLYYDHMHHTWVFNKQLNLQQPQPLAFLAHGAILPIRKKMDNSFRKYGAPKSVHWIVRTDAKGDSRPDGTIRVEADPARSDQEHLQPLLLQKVYHAPEDGTFEGEGDEDDFDLFGEEHEEEEDDEAEVPLDAHGEPVYLPLGARSFQQFVTHRKTSVYHTFNTLHNRYNHEEIVKDPVAFVEKHPHPDLLGPELLDGYSHEEVPHPLRKPIEESDKR